MANKPAQLTSMLNPPPTSPPSMLSNRVNLKPPAKSPHGQSRRAHELEIERIVAEEKAGTSNLKTHSAIQSTLLPAKKANRRQLGNEDMVNEGEFIPGEGAGGIGVVRIADFGLSKVISDSQTVTPCGTVGYTAPETVKDERYSKSVDIWALGCVLYTLLLACGQYTFLSLWWDDISKSAHNLISRLLTMDSDQRYPIKEFLAHPWIRQTDEQSEVATDAPPPATYLSLRHVQKQSGYLCSRPGLLRRLQRSSVRPALGGLEASDRLPLSQSHQPWFNKVWEK
ncbi:serine/threonine-protein kinase srk1 [Aspergillus fumigatus Z5]|nr:serine/threonine-protein kinase srk1 [Aspergillus fumigatus Z5]